MARRALQEEHERPARSLFRSAPGRGDGGRTRAWRPCLVWLSRAGSGALDRGPMIDGPSQRHVGPKSLREERSEETRRALLRSARRLFARPGYAGTTVEDVAARARVTIGALYHHFENKRELMAAVFEEIEDGLIQTVAKAAATKRSPLERLRASFAAFLEACCDPTVRRIAFEEAPAALGWETYREIDERYALGALKQALHALRQAKLLRRFDVDLLAQILLAALVEAGVAMSRGEDPDAVRREARRILDALLDGLTPR